MVNDGANLARILNTKQPGSGGVWGCITSDGLECLSRRRHRECRPVLEGLR